MTSLQSECIQYKNEASRYAIKADNNPKLAEEYMKISNRFKSMYLKCEARKEDTTIENINSLMQIKKEKIPYEDTAKSFRKNPYNSEIKK